MAIANGLKGFANLGAFPTITDTLTEYSASGTKLIFIGASSCSVTDNRTDFSIPGDDGVYDSGAEWTDSTLAPVVHEVDLTTLAALSGATLDEAKTALEEGTFDIPSPIALVFSALRRDGGYRLYRYYVCKLQSYAVSHATKGTSSDGQPYTLTLKCLPRKIDGLVRGTCDIANGAALTWLDAIPTVPEAPTVPETP